MEKLTEIIMKNLGARIKHPKLRGEWAELRFMVGAAERRLQVSKPWGDSASYDVIVEHEGQCVRVQVKSTTHQRHGGHSCQVRGSQRRPYVDTSFDFVAIFLIPEDVWYIIPLEKIQGMRDVSLYPKLKNAKYEKYREAWNLLQPAPDSSAGPIEIQACAEDFPSAGFDPLELWRNRSHLDRLYTYNLPTGNDSWSAEPT